MPEQPIPIASQPGCKRDGTRFDGNNYIDVQWCRFQRGRPRKIGGFQKVTDTVPEIARGMTSFSQDNIQYLHIGHANTLGQYNVSTGTLVAFSDRTPAAIVTSLNNLWQFAIFADTSGGAQTLLVAHAAQNLADIDNSIGADIFIGVVTASTVLDTAGLHADWNTNPVSGGICVTGQYLFTFGSDGVIRQSQINDLSAAPVEFNMGTQKIVAGMALRGSGTGPGILMWALDALIRGTFQVGGPPDFAFDIIAGDTSILSSQGVVEYDGIYYWPGVDRWLMFNGVLREIPNDMNYNYFFDNLNFAQRQKVFGIKIPRFGEIWWCYPRGTATECTHAVIYNVRENTWYDTALPDSNGTEPGRTAGVFANVYELPFMVDNVDTGTGRTLWQHETGYDKVSGVSTTAIQSYFETGEISMLEQEPSSSKSIHVGRVEPDFVQVGDMTMQVSGRQNVKAPVTLGPVKTFPASPSDPTDETIKVKEIRRLMSFRFESNVAGGNYEAGNTFAHIEPADGRIES